MKNPRLSHFVVKFPVRKNENCEENALPALVRRDRVVFENMRFISLHWADERRHYLRVLGERFASGET